MPQIAYSIMCENADLRAKYDAVIQETYQDYKVIHEQHTQLWKRSGEPTAINRQAACQQLTQQSVDEFRKANPKTINRILLGMMGSRRLVVEDGKIIGVSDV